ncbi:zinc ABC transporter ATP-binding protein ZnuC [Candidatus Pantoea edessiphila]|uniref:Zinc ABC transporter ATP-binding protein ZnuC n=1 Tax=Candidatus Pantoea edessiphila TaxID=2044610 RepID=A0A2P5SYQ1_9GAMM|nr:zinc ABC transporter ATP-binding protein ZnuC [Candidatus Pantoea edessiphila]MBK4775439.1 zinc ABC transporter ATP-binding protein ZnuC [Pantoea sp. Edef]PPI87432.1 zinc ABC transporter ATP-binding protein ZnuC [Candidatus Pantoea edessiphila]
MKTLVKLENVSVIYNNRSVLSNINISLKSDHILTLIGPNGAGKSTLVRVILGLLSPSGGKVDRIKGLKIGYVPQNIYIDQTLPITVKGFMNLININKYEDILLALQRVNACHLINLPLQTLSGGEIQRILISRSILNKPQLLVLDEPTQCMDTQGQIAIYDLIDDLRREFSCGVLIVSHDLHLVMAKTNEVICLNNHICCSGSAKSVSQHPEFISMFGLQDIQQLAIYRHHHSNYCEIHKDNHSKKNKEYND